MTQELYQKALKFAGQKHSNQKVPGTKANYLLHISNVAMEVIMAYNFESSFNLNFAIQIAILHDTIEDTDTNYEEIKKIFGQDIAMGVQALTKNENLKSKSERMLDSLNRINTLQKEVGIVKIADRITNLQSPPEHWSREKIIKYHKEAQIISDLLKEKNNYLNKRLESKISDYEKNIIKFKPK
ncbi:bifunctional (p)ppGpp synthetase/guanosine-3',5'-bis(diphosphate) 3'-pyrophosphohydrolase [Tenacibaculum sp. S7007]|uniref:Bifunctional (P)ppGpp synthetase/guanosine-3',5'-bis(Diphosphate) 3'-pyrophosphohydrolase n=1 Tax=Tenacibaculum pelagium TaxID=2759527 RepID=A0A839AQ44_9FLAO|nr:HD domain-containing protein [Tenacibaculum pelagium]MBA6157205.1 bifunctional (p)ppGpp synthetase/guanosine-3',5'-bis(diphosphate) 3'-pyrophosphohydrolase [Tenacibaculum pelagium]